MVCFSGAIVFLNAVRIHIYVHLRHIYHKYVHVKKYHELDHGIIHLATTALQ